MTISVATLKLESLLKGGGSIPSSLSKRLFPTSNFRPDWLALTPLPISQRQSLTVSKEIFLDLAALQIAIAIGCLRPCSALAASCSKSFWE